jgi:hypothetical protein
MGAPSDVSGADNTPEGMLVDNFFNNPEVSGHQIPQASAYSIGLRCPAPAHGA